MHTAVFHESPPPHLVAEQILQMVFTYLSDLSMSAIPRSNLLFELYQWTLPCEVHLYLQQIGKMPAAPVELIVAYDERSPKVVVGFLLYAPVTTHPEACGVSYMAVKESHRGRGIGTAMMRDAIARYPHVELTCSIKNVPFFEQLGFQVIDSHLQQVVMNTRSASTTGHMCVVNVEQIRQSPQAVQIHHQLVSRWGIEAMFDAEKQLQRHTDELERQAASYVRERLA